MSFMLKTWLFHKYSVAEDLLDNWGYVGTFDWHLIYFVCWIYLYILKEQTLPTSFQSFWSNQITKDQKLTRHKWTKKPKKLSRQLASYLVTTKGQ